MTIKPISDRERDSEKSEGAQSSHQDRVDQLAELLPADALEDALKGLEPEEITGPGGLLTQLAGRVIETAFGAEMSEHLGYPPGQAPPGKTANHRNGSTQKTVQTELGPVDIKTPRDRAATFDPKLVGKRQTRLAGLDGLPPVSWTPDVWAVWPGGKDQCSCRRRIPRSSVRALSPWFVAGAAFPTSRAS
jgi:hypothetical protein